MTSKILKNLEDEVEDLGHNPGTPAYERALLKRKVFQCREMRGHFQCTECSAHDECTLYREYLLDIRYPDRRNT